jgi:hypothetical protein
VRAEFRFVGIRIWSWDLDGYLGMAKVELKVHTETDYGVCILSIPKWKVEKVSRK